MHGQQGFSSAVVVTWGGAARLERHLGSVVDQSLPFRSVIVVDNAGDEATADVLRRWPATHLLRLGRNQGFSGGANRGIEHALSDPGVDAVAILNDDVALARGWHAAARSALLSRPDTGACASCLLQAHNPRLLDSAGILWRRAGLADNAGHGQSPPPADAPPREVAGACGAAALLRRALLEEVGLFDETLFAYQEDVDLSLRASARGWRFVLAPGARGLHVGQASNRRFPLGGTWADYYNARNRFTVAVKALPGETWRARAAEILSVQLGLLARSLPERRGGAVAVGLAHGLLRLPSTLRRRREGERRP